MHYSIVEQLLIYGATKMVLLLVLFFNNIITISGINKVFSLYSIVFYSIRTLGNLLNSIINDV